MFVRFLKITFAFLLVFFVCSCSAENRVLFSADIDATVSYLRSGREYTVRYTRAGQCETVEVLAPESLCGLVARRSDGVITVLYSDIEYTSVAYSLFDPFALLSPIEVTRQSDGEYKSVDGKVTVTLFGDIPSEVSGENMTLKIIEFTEGREAK